jgi:hypothetical protein
VSASNLSIQDLSLNHGFQIAFSKHHYIKLKTLKIIIKMNPTKIVRQLTIALTALVSVGIQNTHSALSAQGFEEPSWAEEAGALRAEWLNFSVGFGGEGNAPDVDGSNLDGKLSQLAVGGSVTGSQNIYNPAGASSFEVRGTIGNHVIEIQFQTLVVGTELDYEGLKLALTTGETTQEFETTPVEISRESGGFGDAVVMSWTWKGIDQPVDEYLITFESTGPHTSFAAARLDVRGETNTTNWQEVVMNSPSKDRWNYLFNISPGRRTAASIFRAPEENGFSRHGMFVIGFDTSEIVPPGLSPESYQLESIEFQARLTGNFQVEYDPTPDSVLIFLPEDHEQFQPDADSGHPLELMGVGFRNGWDELSWKEDTEYITGENAERNVFPAVLNDQGEITDASLAVDFENPKELQSLAIGVVAELEPGELLPEGGLVTFTLDLNQDWVRAYVQRGLSIGYLYFSVTGLQSGGQDARTFPEFHTSESLLGTPPSLTMKYAIQQAPASPPQITSLDWSEGRAALAFEGAENGMFQIRHTEDLNTWRVIASPEITQTGEGHYLWVDTEASPMTRMYQVVQIE